MISVIWVVLFVALTGSHCGYGLPVRPTPQDYPHDERTVFAGWGAEGGLYAAIPALALVVTAIVLIFGCTWCYRHKDCKLFTASAQHLHTAQRVQPPDSGFSEPANNNISEDNNNGPISLREMQNIANNNATAYIVSENEERNRISRESVVEFEPLPMGFIGADPLEHCADWFGDEDFPRNNLQYLREIGRGWFGRVVEGEIEEAGASTTVAVKILNQNATLEDKARFLDESRMYRDLTHEHILAFIGKCLQEDPWILILELCTMDLQQYLIANRPKMAILNESGVPLRLMCDVTSALSYLHSRGYTYGGLCGGFVMVRGEADSARAVLGRYAVVEPHHECLPPEVLRRAAHYTTSSEVWSLGTLIWEVCSWGAVPTGRPSPPPDLPCPYKSHLYQVMQLCWNADPSARPTAAQVHALINHLYVTHTQAPSHASGNAHSELYVNNTDFEERWQRLKPNTIPKIDEHVAIVHAPSTSMTSHFTGSDQEFDNNTLSVDMDTAVSRSSSIMSDRDPLSVQIKSESLTNLHGSLEDVRNIYLTHNETAALECHQGNINLEDSRERDQDRSDASMDPWLKDIIAGSQDDVSYYKDVSDVIKNLDNILNSEKTSSSESSHQASPSRDNLSLDCKKEIPMQSSLVKSPGITNFQNILDTGFADKLEEGEPSVDDEVDRDTIGTLSHSFERHSDSISQHTLENLTPDTPMKDFDVFIDIEDQIKDTKEAQVESKMKLQEIDDGETLVKRSEEVENQLKTANIETPMKSATIPETQCQGKHTEGVENTVKCAETAEINSPLKPIPVIGEVERQVKHPDEVENLVKSTVTAEAKRSIKSTPLFEVKCSEIAEVKSLIKPIPVDEVKSEFQGTEEVENRVTCTETVEVKSLTNPTPIAEVESQIKHTEKVENQVEYTETAEDKNPAKPILITTVESQTKNTEKVENRVKCTETTKVNSPTKSTAIAEGESQVKHNEEVENRVKFIETAEVKSPMTSTITSEVASHMKNVKEAGVERQAKQKNFAEVERQIGAIIDVATNIVAEKNKSVEQDIELPNEVVDNHIPKLMELCVAAMLSVSECNNKQLLVRKDCQTPCDNVTEIRTDNEETKSIEVVREVNKDSMPLEEIETTEFVENHEQIDTQEIILPISAEETITSNEGVDTLPSVTDDGSNSTQENDTLHIKLEDIGPESIESEYNYSKDETILVSDLVDTTTDSSKDEQLQKQDYVVKVDVKVDLEPVTPEQMPVSVQNIIDVIKEPATFRQMKEADSEIIKKDIEIKPIHLPPEIVQITDKVTSVQETESLVHKEVVEAKNENLDSKDSKTNNMPRSDSYVVVDIKEQSDDSTIYMDLIYNTNSQILRDSIVDNSVNDLEVNSGLDTASVVNDNTLSQNDSTVYLDLPSFDVIKKTDDFLHMERMISSKHVEKNLIASTPITSDNSVNTLDNTVENLNDETIVMSETKAPHPGTSTTKFEQKCVQDSMSPFESPSHKSHHTDTYDENSSVVLGPFENSALDLFKPAKTSIDPVELPREELLAFSSNFSEINLETPSPLRDGNFLNEVPDIIHDDMQFDDLTSISEPKNDPAEAPSDDTEGSGSGTQKRVSPSTPPNSPGIFLASTSQQKHLVDIDLNNENVNAPEPDSSSLRSIDLTQIELQITSKLAMAENENNLNIEYSGPLTVEGLIEEGGGMRESDAIPESFLAGNGGSIEDVREELSLDEECVKALRNELELKLPLAQVAAIEPQAEGDAEWQGDLPPPPEQLVVTYSGALSPIQEETGPQLSAYENDHNWNPSTRTESSESYPEPCNNSTDSVTELPCRDNTYTVPSRELTYTLHRTDGITMSADSLNASLNKSHRETDEMVSPIDDRTYVKDEERESTCEHISQVSPYLVSPTTDTSDTGDVATRVSTLSHTTLPTEAKLSKPSETQCLSKATSIDSWCSNDTLYNVEENFDDLAMDPDADVPIEYESKEEGNSESTDTLTHNDEDKEHSHCSTYIIHDSRSEPCDTFSPDSITANDNNTYTKVKTEAAQATPSTDLNDSTKNTHTKDLAYGTLMSGMPSYSNCTTELASGLEDPWKLPQPELVRRSPVGDDFDLSPPKLTKDNECVENSSPQLARECSLTKMESIEISCLQNDLNDSRNKCETENRDIIVTIDDSPKYNYRNMVPSQTSTPLGELVADTDNTEPIPMTLSVITPESSECPNLPSFQSFQRSAEDRPQDLLSNATNEGVSNRESILLEGESITPSQNSNRDSLEYTNSYWDFENSAVLKPQNTNSKEMSSQSVESGISSEEFRQFENSIKSRPQDLSSLIDASSMFLMNERNSSELAMSSLTGLRDQTSQSNIRSEMQSQHISPPSLTNLIESHELVDTREPSNSFLINFDVEDETEQPHSIIVTEVPMNSIRISPNRTYDARTEVVSIQTNDSQSDILANQSHTDCVPNRTYDSHTEGILLDFNRTYDSHENRSTVLGERKLNVDQPETNGEKYDEQPVSLIMIEQNPPTTEDRTIANHDLIGDEVVDIPPRHTSKEPLIESHKDLPNGSMELVKTEAVSNAATEAIHVNGGSEKYATVNFLSETFEELIESSVDEGDRLVIDEESPTQETTTDIVAFEAKVASPVIDKSLKTFKDNLPRGSKDSQDELKANGITKSEGKMSAVTGDFLQNEQKYATLDSYFPLLSDIRFTGPASEMMSTSFQDSPTSGTSPECEQDSKPNSAEIRGDMKEWDSDSDSHTSNSSSGEFIWKDGDGHETSVVPSTHFDHQRDGGSGAAPDGGESHGGGDDGVHGSEGSEGSGSGSEGDEVEFVPSSWDCRAAPSKSSLRSLEQVAPDNKKRVVFKRQRYHCVYEYPREAPTPEHSPAYLPDLSTYAEWDPSSAEEAELCYGALFSAAGPLASAYPLRAGIAFGADYEEDFFISSSARPFESLGIMSTTSQFFPGLHAKRSLLERDLADDVTDDFPPPPSPLPLPPPTPTTLTTPRTPSLDLTTPDSGVEDITPGSTAEEEMRPSPEAPWRADSASSSESCSPSSPGSAGELGGLRHTRDKLKLDLPPSPHAPSPRHARVFNFVLDKPKRRDAPSTPLVMTDDTPLLPSPLPLLEDDRLPLPEPTFSTFGKSGHKMEPEAKIVLDEVETSTEVEVDETPKVVEAVKGEGTVLDSGDEDSGIESSSKATLERKASNVS